jgi:mannose-6-phosphate isomerase-like protein (cupin superfamily)
MRTYITGTTPDGLSCIVEEGDVTPAPIPGLGGIAIAGLYKTDTSPPPRPHQQGHFLDIQFPPGALRWQIVEHAPHQHDAAPTTASLVHHTDTIDFIFVLEGSTRLVLDADRRDLGPGDCVVITGVDHGFEAGADGCRMMSFGVGTPPPG